MRSPTPNKRRPLESYSEIAVVLGGGLLSDGAPNELTLLRATAAAQLATDRDVGLIVSGSHGDGPKPACTEAEFMAERLIELGVSPERIFVEDQSRDTASNAAFVAERYFTRVTPRRLIIVTSPFHMSRALTIFRMVLGSAWTLEAYPAPEARDEAAHAKVQAAYLAHTREQLAGIEPGDIARIAARLRETMHEHVSDE